MVRDVDLRWNSLYRAIVKPKDGAFVVLFNDELLDKVFLIYRPDKSIWNLPGGGIEANERPTDAALRETKEETGFTLNRLVFKGVHKNIISANGEVLNTTYLYTSIGPSGDFKPEFPGSEGKWFSVENLPQNIQSITSTRVRDALDNGVSPFMKDFYGMR